MSDEPEFPQGPALRADGTLEGRGQPEASPPVDTAPEQPLELASRPPRRAYSAPTAYRPEPERRRWLPAVLVGFVVAGLGIAAAAMLLPQTTARLPAVELPTAVREALPAELSGPPVVIESEPSGATIRTATGVVGITPWAGNNTFLTDTELTLTLPGHLPGKVVLPGAREAHLSVTLRRSPR